MCRVPDDAPPLDRHGREYWPPGWGPGSTGRGGGGGGDASGEHAAQQAPLVPGGSGKVATTGGGGRGKRAVRTQRDAFEVLGLPYREPWQRDC
mgnify:CR=1 FL=1